MKIMAASLIFLGCSAVFGQNAITGGGTANTVPLFSGSATLSDSVITQSGGNVGIGTTSPPSTLSVYTGASNGSDSVAVASALNITNVSTWGGFITALGYTNIGVSSVVPSPGTSSKVAFYSLVSPSSALGAGLYIDGAAGGNNYGIYSPVEGLQSYFNGNVGIGTANPQAKLEVNGSLRFTADGSVQTTAWTGVLCGGDYAEAVNASGPKQSYEPGDVLVLTEGDNDEVQKSSEPYSSLVAGIIATKPGVIGRRESLPKDGPELPMAMVGIVPTKVTAENGPIKKGDLLVTSSLPGYAMKGTDRAKMLGAIIGKAMGSLNSGTGVIEVLVTLQ